MGIEIRNLEAAYEDRVIIPCANVTIPEGKITMMIGPNGCGKSTLLKSIARILPINTTRLTGNVVNLRSFIYKTTYDFIGFQHESFKYTHKKTTITKKVIVSSFISID